MLVGQIREVDAPAFPNTLATHKMTGMRWPAGPWAGCGVEPKDWKGKKMTWIIHEADQPTCQHKGCRGSNL